MFRVMGFLTGAVLVIGSFVMLLGPAAWDSDTAVEVSEAVADPVEHRRAGDDPGLGIVFVPLGALALFGAVALAAWSVQKGGT